MKIINAEELFSGKYTRGDIDKYLLFLLLEMRTLLEEENKNIVDLKKQIAELRKTNES